LTSDPKLSRLELAADSSAVVQAAEEARSAGRFGMDTEFLRERTFRARLCLVQVSTPDSIYLLDPLEGIDMTPLAKLIADPDVLVVVHAGRQDFELFVERFGTVPANVFDIQMAAGFAGYGASLPYGRLVEETTGGQARKGEAYTDWCRRPLTTAQLTYAADDVRYLLPVADALEARLESLGRFGWIREEMSALERAETYSSDPTEVWKRVSGRGVLTGRQTAVLKEVARWREGVAERRDTPRGWVVKDPTLIEIARRAPADVAGLKGIRGLNTKEAERSGRDILAAVKQGRAAPPIPPPPGLPRGAIARVRMVSGLADAIVRARCEAAEIASELVATRADLENLLAGVFSGTLEPERYRLLRGWRRELVGQAIVDLAAGRIAVRVVDRPPYVEEVAL
jgi:ribonuclease D